MADTFADQQRKARKFFGTGEFSEEADKKVNKETNLSNNEAFADIDDDYEDEVYNEEDEWGPGGQPSASKQLKIYNKSLKKNNKKKNKKIKGKGNPLPPEPPVLRYPFEGMTQHTDYLQIDIVEYKPAGKKETVKVGVNVLEKDKTVRKIEEKEITSFKGKLGHRRNSNKFKQAGRTRPYGLSVRPIKNEGTILLPIPSNVQDGNSVSW